MVASRRRSPHQSAASSRSKSAQRSLQSFVLEPILTPSGIVDGGDDSPDLADVDVPEIDNVPEIDDALDADALNADGIDDAPVSETPDDIEPVDFVYDLTEEVDTDVISNPVNEFSFDSGTFVVGESGEVSFDFLFDGGRYEGELAIFSLDGMEEFEPGSDEFIQEAARRALSESELGYVVISDRTEGARFSGSLGEAKDWNQDDYLGTKSFQMRPEDEFGIMLVPNGRVEQVFDDPGVEGSRRPLFSMSTANPDDAFHLGQIVDVTGDGNTFVLEDQRIDLGSDRDYNDFVFQIRGAVGTAEAFDEVVDPADDWRTNTDLGKALVEYTKPYITPDVPEETEVAEFTPIETVEESNELPSLDVLTSDVSVDAAPEDQPLIGIIDTGFSGNNPDIDYSNITLGSDRVDGDNNPLLATGEGNEHGTHVLGVIAAERDNGIGIDGVNDEAPVWIGRGVGSGEWADSLVEFVEHFRETDQPNAVVNLSMDLTQVDAEGNVTTRYELTPAERAAIEYARQHNIVLVVAAGNDGGVMSALGQASQEFDNIITVGSAERVTADFAAANAYERADYSSYGQGIDILAPGGTVDNPELSTVSDGVGSQAGTSVATAKVTGAVSQVWAANPDLSYHQVIDLIKSTATDLHDPNWDTETGAGLLNIAAAVSMARTKTPEKLTDIPATLIPDTWSGAGVVTPGERAVAIQIGGQYYEWEPYTVRSGDFLSSIAARTTGNANNWSVIYDRNRATISNPNLIYPGQVIWVPRQVAAPTPTPTPTPTPAPTPVPNSPVTNPNTPAPGIPGRSSLYLVKPGDTLWSIAQRRLGDGNRWREIMKTPGGGTFTEAEARRLQLDQPVYLPVSYQRGTGKPVVQPPTNQPKPATGKINIGAVINSVPANIRAYAQQSIPLILEAAANAGITDLGQIAYILATSEHESLAGKYMEELASGWAYEYRADLGNTQSGDGPRFKGRGYVQITGRTNYTNWARRLGQDLVNNPALASVPAIAAQILVEGMRGGSFTGVGLSRYINGATRDFYNARRIVNGIDRANHIAGIAERYYNVLVSSVQPSTGSGAVGSVEVGGTPLNPPAPANILLRPTTQNLNFGRGQEWVTPTGFKFRFQLDGNLVLYNPQGRAVWATGTNGTTADRFSVQTDGNVVLYDRGKAVWATDTSGNPGAYFAIQGDGNLVVYSSSGKALYDSATHSGRIGTLSASPEWLGRQKIVLRAGSTNLNFSRGQEWITPNGHKFVFQTDGNLVLYNPQGQPTWATGTDGTTADRFSVQTDGNVVLYDQGRAVWATNTSGNPGASFAIQGDGNLVVRSSSGQPIYDSGTHSGRIGTLSAAAGWLRDRNLRYFPGLQFTTVTSEATGKALDAGGSKGSVYPHPSPNSGNAFHQWGFEKVGDHYMIINNATGKALDAGGANGMQPYTHPDPNKQNPYQLWKLTPVGGAYLITSKATGRALDSGGANGNGIYMYPSPIPSNPFHQWKLNLPGGGTTGKPPILSRQNAQYFSARPQFYTTGNIFAQSMYGSSLVGGRGYTEGNCTWYAHGRLLELGKKPAAMRTMSGNANQWHAQLSNGSYTTSSPQVGDIAQWTRWYTDSSGTRRQMNHVAVVEKVNSNGTITISESHYNTNWDGGNAGTLHDVRTISANNPDRYIRVPNA